MTQNPIILRYHFGNFVHLRVNQSLRPTQPPILDGSGKKYRPNGDELMMSVSPTKIMYSLNHIILYTQRTFSSAF